MCEKGNVVPTFPVAVYPNGSEKLGSPLGVEGCFRYINKLWRIVVQLRPVNIIKVV